MLVLAPPFGFVQKCVSGAIVGNGRLICAIVVGHLDLSKPWFLQYDIKGPMAVKDLKPAGRTDSTNTDGSEPFAQWFELCTVGDFDVCR